MTIQVINVGAAPNDGTGDPLRTAFQKCNTNFASFRTRLTADTTYYVDAITGNDSNTGLTPGTAFKTLQYAYTFLAASLDLGNFNLTIRLAGAGPYTCDPNVGFAGFTGNLGSVTLQGDGTPTEVQDAFWVGVAGCQVIVLRDLKFTAPIQGIGIQSYMTGFLAIGGNIAFDNCATACMFASNNGTILNSFGAQISVTGNSIAFGWAADMGQLYFETGHGIGTVITMVGTPAFSQATMIAVGQGQINAAQSQLSFIGAATGVRYDIDGLSLIATYGGGANFIPGNQAGVTSNGGVYIA